MNELSTSGRALVDLAARRSPIQWWMERRARRCVVVLAYHDVRDADTFKRQMDFLTSRCRPVSIETLLGLRGEQEQLPERAVLVTFDDGDRSVLDVAAPILSERSVPAVVFVVAAAVKERQMFWWDEVELLLASGAASTRMPGGGSTTAIRHLKTVADEERRETVDELRASIPEIPWSRDGHLRPDELRTLEEMGIEVGNHTVTHPILPRCGDGVVHREIGAAHSTLKDILGHPPRTFAYPNGDWDARAEATLEALGYEAAFLFDHRVAPLPVAHSLRVSRVRANASASLDRFATLLSGLHPAIHRLRGRR